MLSAGMGANESSVHFELLSFKIMLYTTGFSSTTVIVLYSEFIKVLKCFKFCMLEDVDML